jgi:hypothetical protein
MATGWRFEETVRGEGGFEATVRYGRVDELVMWIEMWGRGGPSVEAFAQIQAHLTVPEARELGQALIDAATTADEARAAEEERTLKRFAGNKSATMRSAG